MDEAEWIGQKEEIDALVISLNITIVSSVIVFWQSTSVGVSLLPVLAMTSGHFCLHRGLDVVGKNVEGILEIGMHTDLDPNKNSEVLAVCLTLNGENDLQLLQWER